jgi:hypothetical protein
LCNTQNYVINELAMENNVKNYLQSTFIEH